MGFSKDNALVNPISKKKIRTLTLPFKCIAEVRDEKEFVTLGEYVIPHTCSWFYSNLNGSLSKLIYRHEGLDHPTQTGIILMEYLKQGHLFPGHLTWLTEDTVRQIKDELEGLAIIHAILCFGEDETLNESELVTLINNPSLPYSVDLFLDIVDLIIEKTPAQDFFTILLELYQNSPYIYDKKTEKQVPSANVFSVILDKLIEEDPPKMDVNIFVTILSCIMKKNHWLLLGSPRAIRTVFSLMWASVLDVENISKYALRNFLETAFRVPINVCFSVDSRSFIAQRIPIINRIHRIKLIPRQNKPLGLFVNCLTEELKRCAYEMEKGSFGEERFLLQKLPNVASLYIDQIVRDLKDEKPKLLTQWKGLSFQGRGQWPLEFYAHEPLCEFIKNYDKEEFEKTVKDLIPEALYYPEDCIDIVEKRAEEIYNNFGDIADTIFENTKISVN